MPLTAEARVRSQDSLRDICGANIGGGRFSYSTSVFPHQYRATDAPHSPTSSGQSLVTLKHNVLSEIGYSG